jgi:hypothetical protein
MIQLFCPLLPAPLLLQLLLVAGIVANDWLRESAFVNPCLYLHPRVTLSPLSVSQHRTAAMVNLIAVLLVPVAVILSDTLGGGASDFNSSYTESKAVWANFGTCFFGVIITSMFGAEEKKEGS